MACGYCGNNQSLAKMCKSQVAGRNLVIALVTSSLHEKRQLFCKQSATTDQEQKWTVCLQSKSCTFLLPCRGITFTGAQYPVYCQQFPGNNNQALSQICNIICVLSDILYVIYILSINNVNKLLCFYPPI